MNRTETYSGSRQKEDEKSSSRVKDVDTWIGNSLATILAGLGVAAGVIGLLVAFGYLNDNATNPFEDGMVWMIGGIILTLAGNVFRREHHIVDPQTPRSVSAQPLQGGAETRGYSTRTIDDDVRMGQGDLSSGTGGSQQGDLGGIDTSSTSHVDHNHDVDDQTGRR